MFKLLNFLKGYVYIVVDGYFTERFINVCINDDILLWDIKRLGETRITAKITPRDFKRVRNAAKKTKSSIKITTKKGLPLLLFRYRKRKIAIIGIAIFIYMIMFFSSHVMGIDITGNERISTEKILNSLKDFGIYTCAPIKTIDRRQVQNKMVTRFDEISWIGVNIRGSRVYIEVRERIDTEEGIPLDKPCDLIAKEDGIIDLLNVREGQSLVKRNEFVEKGDLLVSGAVDSLKKGIRYVHSYGEIYAITERNLSGEYDLQFKERKNTGEYKNKYSVKILGRNINLFLKKEPEFKIYETKKDVKEISLYKNLLPTIYIEKTAYAEQTEILVKKTEKEIYEKAKKELSEEIKKTFSDSTEILNISSTCEKINENKIKVFVNFKLREDIATERAIDKIENLNYDIKISE